MPLKCVFLFLVSFCAKTFGVDFEQYVSVQHKTIADSVVNFTTRLPIFCIQGCNTIAGCESVSYSELTATCVIHDKHPLQEDATLTESPAFTLYYNYNCPSGWYLFRGKCYLFSSNQLTWDDSKAYCATIGGSFVMIESEDEQLFIEGVVETIYSGNSLAHHYWIGGFYSSQSGSFLWHDLTDIQYYGWGGPNPNINTGCIDIDHFIAWKWNDHGNCLTALRFICEKGKYVLIHLLEV